MTDLTTIPAVRFNGSNLSLGEVLQSLHRRGQLQPILTDVAAERLLVDSARKEGLDVSGDEVANAVSRFRIAARLHKREDTEKWLTRNRLTQDDLETDMQNTMLRRKMFAKIANREAVEEFFRQHRDRFDRVRLSRIVVNEEELANELMAQIKEEGADYLELLKQHSIDERGKRLGPCIVRRKQLPANIEQAVFAAKKDDVVGPFQVGKAWHLLKVHRILPGQLSNPTARAIRRLLFERWLREQMQQAKIEIQLP